MVVIRYLSGDEKTGKVLNFGWVFGMDVTGLKHRKLYILVRHIAKKTIYVTGLIK